MIKPAKLVSAVTLFIISENACAHDPELALMLFGGFALVVIVIPLLLIALIKRTNRKSYFLLALLSVPFIWVFAMIEWLGGASLSAAVPWLVFIGYMIKETPVKTEKSHQHQAQQDRNQ